MICTRYGVLVRIDRVADKRDFVEFEGHQPTRHVAKEIKAGRYLVLKGIDGAPWTCVRHISDLRADDGAKEIDAAIAALSTGQPSTT